MEKSILKDLLPVQAFLELESGTKILREVTFNPNPTRMAQF